MGKTLFYVSRMYTEVEFKNLAAYVPDDFKQKTSEFWSYVRERLLKLSGKVNKIYRDGIFKDDLEASSQLRSIDNENYLVIKSLVEKGAHFVATEDPILVGESESWVTMLENQKSNIVIQELFQKNLEERIRYISDRIEQTLKDNEVGVLFLKPNLRVELNKSIKVIRMWRFDPSDYLKSWQVQLRLKSTAKKNEDVN
ncbi:MAG: hypothetical protein NWE80_05065 [Candidatus Bathyarchaeota archaeon]|nr:hypothetical protein [Candidatus Bathyarchaeota archaeon]